MDFIDSVNELAAKIQRDKDSLLTEEATKTACVMPFINMLGYNVFSPKEVIPEFTADIGMKKGEKVDYCIQKDEHPVMLIECKPYSSELTAENSSQLFRYFAVTKVRFAILTNGITYRFFADLEKQNVMDQKPFFEFDFAEYSDASVSELKKFSKNSFDLEQILATASELKYTREIKKILNEQMTAPSESFVRLLASEVYPGPKSQKVIAQFTEIIQRACQQLISEKISDRLKSALEDERTALQPQVPIPQVPNDEDNRDTEAMTQEATEAFLTVRAILRQTTDVGRVVMRSSKNHISVLLDNTNRKPICHLHFGKAGLCLGVFDMEKNEAMVQLKSLTDMYAYADQILATVASYESWKQETAA